MPVHVAAKLRQERILIDARKTERADRVLNHATVQGVVDIVKVNVIVRLDGLECRIAQVLIDLICAFTALSLAFRDDHEESSLFSLE